MTHLVCFASWPRDDHGHPGVALVAVFYVLHEQTPQTYKRPLWFGQAEANISLRYSDMASDADAIAQLVALAQNEYAFTFQAVTPY